MAAAVTSPNQVDTRAKMAQKVSPELIAFADSLTPSKDFVKVGKETLQQVFDRIKRDPNFKVDRCLPGGSVGKNTSVLYPDFDAVVFLHKKQPPLVDCVEDFRDILKNEADSFGVIKDSVTWSSNTVTLEYKNGVEMDLLPACSFSQDPEQQYKEVMKQLKVYPEKSASFSSSLADVQIQFMKDQPGSTHQLIRLLKYWYKSLPMEKVYGGSYLMEVLAVTVANENKAKVEADHKAKKPVRKTVPMFDEFKGVLQKLSKLNVLKIAYLLQNKEFKLLSEQQIPTFKNEFHADILKRPRFIIDPSNPYNDLLKNLTDEGADDLRKYATAMLRRIERLESVESNELKTVIGNMERVILYIDKVFAPIVFSIKEFCTEKGKNPRLPKSIIIHYDYQSYSSSESRTRTKHDSFFQCNPDCKKMTKFILSNLVTLVRNKARRQENGSPNAKYIFLNGLADIEKKEDVKKAIAGFLEAQEFPPNSVRIQELASNRDHDDCDVTLYIPYSFKDKILAVRFSMKW